MISPLRHVCNAGGLYWFTQCSSSLFVLLILLMVSLGMANLYAASRRAQFIGYVAKAGAVRSTVEGVSGSFSPSAQLRPDAGGSEGDGNNDMKTHF
jgi:hypothetical protein